MVTMNLTRALLVLLVLCPAVLAGPKEDAGDLNDQALAALKKGDHAEAIRLLGEARALLPLDETLRKNLAAVHARRGLLLAKKDEDEKALKDFKWATHYDPDQAAYRVNLALSYMSLKQFYEAKKEFERVLVKAPKNPDAQEHYGRLLYREGNLDGAIKAFKAALAADPKRKRVKTLLEKAERERKVESTMKKDIGANFAITFDGERSERVAREVMQLLESAYTVVGDALGHYPRERVQVILYTKEQFRAATEAKSWVGGLYDGKIRLPVRGLRGTEVQLKRTILHEYVHVVVRDLAPRCPIWLNEGLAQLLEGRSVVSSDRKAMAAESAGRLLEMKALRRPFSTIKKSEEAELAYAQSHSMVAWLSRNRGAGSFGDFLRAMKSGKTPDKAFEHAFRNTPGEVLSHWREEIHRRAESLRRK